MTLTPYINKAEFELVLDIIETSAKFQRMKALADSGNVQAAWYYGNVLMIGGWDESRMDVDYLRKNILPETPDPLKDPYLLVPRDQYAAVHYHKIAASFPDEKKANEIKYSRIILEYCRTKADIGYDGTGNPDRFYMKSFENYAKAASPENVKANPFIPYPYKRPEVKNPKTKIFECLASRMLNRIYIEILGAGKLISILSFEYMILCIKRKENLISAPLITFNLITFMTIIVPLLFALFICKKYGINESRPICSCAIIKKSYQNNLDRLPEDCRTGADPFLETPLLIRNFHHIKHAIFAMNIVVSLILIGLQVTNFIDLTYELKYVVGVAFLSSIMILLFDKQLCLVDRDCEVTSKPILFNGNGFPQTQTTWKDYVGLLR